MTLTEKEIDMLVQRHRGNSYDHLARAIESAVMSKLAEQAGDPVSYEFQGGDGKWNSFIDRRHYENTVADGSWPIRKLFDESQLIAAQQRTAEACARYCARTLSPSKPIPNDASRAWIAGTIHCTDGIRNGEWREYL